MANFLNKKTLKDIDLDNKTVIARLDLNVPMKDGTITDNKRIVACLPTLNYLLDHNDKIIVLSHLSRIKSLDDIKSNKKSLAIVANELQRLLPNYSVKFLNTNVGNQVIEAVKQLQNKQILVLENTRYNDVNEQGEVVKKESKCDPELGKFWASLADVYVNDAFGTAHRKHASNVGIAQNIKTSAIGFLMEKELTNLSKVCVNPSKPFVAIIGGAKVSDKLKVINQLLDLADKVIIGGGMAYTFLKSQGYDVGNSLVEQEMLEEAHKILTKGANKIVLPVDANCANEFADQTPIYRTNQQGLNNLMGLDTGKLTNELFANALHDAKTVL